MEEWRGAPGGSWGCSAGGSPDPAADMPADFPWLSRQPWGVRALSIPSSWIWSMEPSKLKWRRQGRQGAEIRAVITGSRPGSSGKQLSPPSLNVLICKVEVMTAPALLLLWGG